MVVVGILRVPRSGLGTIGARDDSSLQRWLASSGSVGADVTGYADDTAISQSGCINPLTVPTGVASTNT